MASIERALTWAVNIANNPAHGYDQPTRYGGVDYDCSSLVQTALKQGGYDVPGWFYTGNEISVLTSHGWKWHAGLTGIARGDVLWKPGHTALYMGGDQRVEAWMNEHNGASGGTPGDQTGQEIRVHSPYNDDSFTGYLRRPNYSTTVTKVVSQSLEDDRMVALVYSYRAGSDGKGAVKGPLKYYDGSKIHPLKHPDELKAIQLAYKTATGHNLPLLTFSTEAWKTRFEQGVTR